MILEKVDLYEYFGRERCGKEKGSLTAYLHTPIREMGIKERRPAILVIPGGGYAFVSGREGEPVALAFYAQGFNAFVLDYSVAPAFHYPAPLLEAGMAMLYIRERAEALGCTEDKIAAIGFSAGGHLAGLISLFYEDKALIEAFGGRCKRIRPDATIYGYPVVSTEKVNIHEDSFVNLCGGAVRAEDYSLEKKVVSSSSPAFIWTTMDDEGVPCFNSFVLAEAYARAGVPCELHVFEHGDHGLSTCSFDVLADDHAPERAKRVAAWLPMCFDFLKDKGFCPHKIQ